MEIESLQASPDQMENFERVCTGGDALNLKELREPALGVTRGTMAVDSNGVWGNLGWRLATLASGLLISRCSVARVYVVDCDSAPNMAAAAGDKNSTDSSSSSSLASKSLDDASLPVNFHGNLASAHSDEELLTLLQRAKSCKKPAIVTYGAPWCHACRQMLPTFCNLSNDYESAMFIYADVEKCCETTRDVRYTPTFRFFHDGEKMDEFYGAGPQRLRDRVWLHTGVP